MRAKTKTYIAVHDILLKNRVSQTATVGPRDSDHELLIQFMQFHLGVNLTQRQIDLIRTVSFESITRARRKLQEEGHFLPSPKVAKKRKLKGYKIKQVASNLSAAGLQRRIEENGQTN